MCCISRSTASAMEAAFVPFRENAGCTAECLCRYASRLHNVRVTVCLQSWSSRWGDSMMSRPDKGAACFLALLLLAFFACRPTVIFLKSKHFFRSSKLPRAQLTWKGAEDASLGMSLSHPLASSRAWPHAAVDPHRRAATWCKNPHPLRLSCFATLQAPWPVFRCGLECALHTNVVLSNDLASHRSQADEPAPIPHVAR